MEFTKTAQYHDATNITPEAKLFSTIIYVVTAVISIYHGTPHEIHQTSSVHDATNDTRDLIFS